MQTSTEAVNSTYKQGVMESSSWKLLKWHSSTQAYLKALISNPCCCLFVCLFFAEQLNRSFTAKDSKLS